MNEQLRYFFEGFPPLPNLLQGILWRLSGSANATGVINYLAFATFLAVYQFGLGAPFWLVALGSLTAPLVLIHATVSYVDLFGNSFLAIGVSALIYSHLHSPPIDQGVRRLGLSGLVGAAWSKFQLVPVVGLTR